jgi:DNA-binding NtrC family response regulator
MPSLRFFRGADLLLEHRLRSGRTVVGRADTCDVALPGDEVSREHAVITHRGERTELQDKSRHGTWVNGERVSDTVNLEDGAVITIGAYRVEVALSRAESAPTAPKEPDLGHELLVCSEDGSLQVERAVLVVVSGDREGRRITLKNPRVSLGGPGSHVELFGSSVVPQHAWLRVARGRVMVEPARGAVFLDGERVREITPVNLDEELRIGDVVVRIERRIEDQVPFANRFGDMVGESKSMKTLFGTLRRMAGHHFTVLIIGESGTGKELVARGIHEHSARAEKPFVAMNCGAISEQLFESELFGHEKGAFTGADRRKEGAFHQADGGTLFLDEIGELPEAAQSKLLRTLETGEVRRVGSTDVSFPDVRVVAATNRDLLRAVARGTFRQDLYFRLAVLSVTVPPLRDRTGDIELLSKTLLRHLDASAVITADALEVLRDHDWPGNVRELRNVLTRAYVLHGPRISAQTLSFHASGAPMAPRGAPVAAGATIPPPMVAEPNMPPGQSEEVERAFIASVLRKHGDNRSSAARELGLARSSLIYKMRKLGMT